MIYFALWPDAHGPTKFKFPNTISGGPLGPNAIYLSIHNHWAKAGPVARLTSSYFAFKGKKSWGMPQIVDQSFFLGITIWANLPNF